MIQRKDHSERSQKGIFAGYPLDQPLCYKVFLSGPPPSIKVSTHIAFANNEYVTNLLLQDESCKDITTLQSPITSSSVEGTNSDIVFDTSALQPEVASSDNAFFQLSDTIIPVLKEADHLKALISENSSDYKHLIGEDMRDDEDKLIYRVLSIYRYKGYLAVDRGLVLSMGNIQPVDDPIWLGDAIKLINEYRNELSNTLLLTLPNLLTYTDNQYNNHNNNNNVNDNFVVSDDSLIRLNKIVNNDNIVHNVLEAGLVVTDIAIPSTHKQALKSAQSEKWLQAEDTEIHSLQKKKVLHPCTLPEGKSAISTRWIYRVKYFQDGSINLFKARLVARGYEQILGIDFDETFSPVVRLTSLRIIFALSIHHNLVIHTMDVETAFLNAPLEEETYIKPPAGFVLSPGHNCFRLLKALYGLKQSPRAWNNHLNAYLELIGFSKLISDTCVYMKRYDNSLCILAIYVDDLIIAASNNDILNEVKKLLKNNYIIKDLGPINNILGCHVNQNIILGTITMDQSFYIKNILKTFFPDGLNSTEVPMASSTILSLNDSPTTDDEKEQMIKFPYRQAVGSLLWVASGTRPDISYSVSQVARFNSNPGIIHWKAIVKIFRYLQGTINLGIKFSRSDYVNIPNNVTMTGYADSDHGRCIDTRRSITGYIFLMCNGPISWQSKQQSSVALSSMEAEYMALCAATQEAIWLRMILTDFDKLFNETIIIYDDNQSCIDYTRNPTMYKRTKHIDQRYHFVKDQVLLKTITVKKISTDDNIADLLTKPLDAARFLLLLSQFIHQLA